MKICGLTRAADVAACLALGVEWVGFNLYPGSKRFVALEAARKLWTEARSAHPTAATRVALVLVGTSVEEGLAAARLFPEAAALQLHGSETPTTVAELRRRLPPTVALIKAVGVEGAADVQRAEAFARDAALVLFDSARIPSGAVVAGGSGSTFDWALLAGFQAAPFGLAGGLTPTNVAGAAATRAALLDVSSGVETAPGHKDHALVRAFVAAARRGVSA